MVAANEVVGDNDSR